MSPIESSNAFKRLNAFARAAQNAAGFFDAPIAVLSLVEMDQPAGMVPMRIGDSEATSVPVVESIRATRLGSKLTGASHFRFCASALLHDANKKVIGSLRVMDLNPRRATARQNAALEDLARSVSKELQLSGDVRRLEAAIADRDQTIEILQRHGERLEEFLTIASDATWELDADLRAVTVEGAFSFDADILGKTIFEFASKNSSDQALWAAHREDLIARRPFRAFVFSISPADGSTVWLEGNGNPVFDEQGTFRGYRGTTRNITQRKKVEEQLAFAERHDPLTHLLNRTAFRERVEHRLTLVGRRKLMALFCLDLDDFKTVNDTLGYLVGDKLLQAVAERLAACAARESDTIACIGGDEFALIQVDLPRPELAGVLAQRILAAVRAPYDIDGHHIVTGFSIGIAATPKDGADPDMLIKCAGIALYRAKADGRGTYRFFELEMDARLQEQYRLEMDLREGLANGEFVLFYQPILTTQSGRIIGFEALLRWNHPRRGVVSPAAFIPVAEKTGLIVPIGEWVMREACAEAANWPDHIKIAVNLSPAQFKDPNLIHIVIDALEKSKVAIDRLELEITESLLLKNSLTILTTLHHLRDLGIGISMDDFGTGFSSLTNLRGFPFSKIKIDQSFVRDIPQQSAANGIVRAIIALGVALGMETVAEGVETEAQLAMLNAAGCGAVQGYYLHRPMQAERARGLANGVAPSC